MISASILASFLNSFVILFTPFSQTNFGMRSGPSIFPFSSKNDRPQIPAVNYFRSKSCLGASGLLKPGHTWNENPPKKRRRVPHTYPICHLGWFSYVVSIVFGWFWTFSLAFPVWETCDGFWIFFKTILALFWFGIILACPQGHFWYISAPFFICFCSLFFGCKPL